MAITLIKNQAVNFRLLTDIEADVCACSYKCYCQKVNKFDASKFQIISSNVVSNGNFDNGLVGWVIKSPILLTLVITNESFLGTCDGEVVINATGGTPAYQYSLDGITFQISNTFTGLCIGEYNVFVKDTLDNYGFANFSIDKNVDCADYAIPDLFDLINLNLSQIINCELNDVL